MILARTARTAGHAIKAIGLALALAALPQAALAAPAAAPAAEAAAETPAAAAPVAAAPAPAAPAASAAAATAPAAPAVDPNDPRFQIAPGGYTPMAPTPGKGMPVDKGIGLQTQYSPTGDYARWMHDAFLMPIITVISLFVLGLLLWVVARFNKRANPVASKTSHNTLLEVIWTGLPILILVAIAVPSVTLIAKQYKPAPAKAVTIKATGNQWFWTYTYPDNGGFEVISNMLPEEEAKKRGEPTHLAADFRMVVPAGEPIRLQVTAADVIHAFAVPSLWSKLDAVPGRINEKVLFIKEPGVYYGQCSELCGARHGYMPIVVEALPRPQYNAWVMTQAGGKVDGLPEAPAAAAPAAAPAADPAAAAAPAAAPAASPAPAA
jgi:cytochrome c oxidase subunit 2